ncbi:MAG: ABC transporter substrate-binding protein [Chloroflexi bacterium]|nr:ABC transporter substrate-binding protein [Chloroflexota bacterium]
MNGDPFANDPTVTAWSLPRTALSRRALLRRSALALAGLAALPSLGLLTACQAEAPKPPAAATAAPAAAPTQAPAAAPTQAPVAKSANKTIVIGTSGGPFLDNLKKHILDPFAKQTGADVQVSAGAFPAIAAALRASKDKPPYDFVSISAELILQMIADDFWVKLTPENVPNLKDMYPMAYEPFKSYAAALDYASQGLAVNTEMVKSPPQSWKEFIEQGAAGAYGKNIFFNNLPSGVAGIFVMMKLAQVMSGDPKNADAAFDAVKRIKPNVAKFFTSYSDPVDLLTRKEATVGVGFDGRVYIAHDETNGKITWIKPKDGAAGTLAAFAVVRRGNEEWALKLANHVVDAEPQSSFVNAMFYGSLNKKVKYSEKLAQRIPPPSEVQPPDYEFIVQNQDKWIERWNKEIAN